MDEFANVEFLYKVFFRFLANILGWIKCEIQYRIGLFVYAKGVCNQINSIGSMWIHWEVSWHTQIIYEMANWLLDGFEID